MGWLGTRRMPGQLVLFWIPTLVIRGGESHPAMQRVNEILSERLNGAPLATIEGAAHFMIATHVAEVARLVAQHARLADATPVAMSAVD